jgi:hypothetical protein
MKIVNSTPFDTARLREIAQRVAEQELDPNQRRGITVHFTVTKSRTKEAYRSRRLGFYVRQRGPLVPGLKYNQAIVDIHKSRAIENPVQHAAYVAHELAHEFAEMCGYTHEQMRSPRYLYREGWEKQVEWTKDFPLLLKAKPVKPDRSAVIQTKLAHCKARLEKARSREKRATTIRKKWETRVRYYVKKEQANVGQNETETQQERNSAAGQEPAAVRHGTAEVDLQPVRGEGAPSGPGLSA